MLQTFPCSRFQPKAGQIASIFSGSLAPSGSRLSDSQQLVRGYIRVNERLETSALGIWAMGECAGSPQFTHAAFDDFRVVRDNLAGGSRTTRGRLVPYCAFIDPNSAASD
jgi:hypothetical protein